MSVADFTRLVGVRLPIQLAPMPEVGTKELVSTVADTGALGMVGLPLLTAADVEQRLDEIRSRTRGVFGVNFLVPFLDRDCLDVAIRATRLVEFFFGDPDRALVEHAHRAGAMVSWQVGSLAEAIAAQEAGCDFLVAQGSEAGGHVRGQTRLLPLLAEVLDAVRVPVLAAGGIATAADLRRVLDAGASGARVGTRFVASTESGAHPVWVQALLEAGAADTCLTGAFAAMWPEAPHRVLRSAIEAGRAMRDPTVGMMRIGDRVLPVPRLSALAPSVKTSGHIEAMALYAGESVERVHEVKAGAEIVAELAAGLDVG